MHAPARSREAHRLLIVSNAPTINRAKLDSLRDRHATLRAEYQRRVALGYDLSLKASRLRDEGRTLVAPSPARTEEDPSGVFVGQFIGRNDARAEAEKAEARAAVLAIFDLSADELLGINTETLPAGASDLIARIVDAERKAEKTQALVARLAQQTRDARALLDRLEAFARLKAHQR